MAKHTASDPFRPADDKEAAGKLATPDVHVYGDRNRCATDTRGFATPRNLSPFEIVVDASDGFVPLWDEHVTLRWRFNESSFGYFEDPSAAKAAIEELFGQALMAWGEAVPVKFAKRDHAWDFEILMQQGDDCDINGCVLASAFFPDAGRHKLRLYPKMFEQSAQEQLETLVHELGHVFGLRHFFANVSETAWPSEIFGTHEAFSIMNYGSKSVLTDADRSDLARLYEEARNGRMTEVNGTDIRLVRPFHTVGKHG